MGDPAGTGPELITKACSSPDVLAVCRPVIIGDLGVMRAAARFTDCAAELRVIETVAEVNDSGAIHVVDLKNVNLDKLVRGQVSASCGGAAYDYIKRAVELTQSGSTHAVVIVGPNDEVAGMVTQTALLAAFSRP